MPEEMYIRIYWRRNNTAGLARAEAGIVGNSYRTGGIISIIIIIAVDQTFTIVNLWVDWKRSRNICERAMKIKAFTN